MVVKARRDAQLQLLLQFQQIFHLLATFTWIAVGQVVINGGSQFFSTQRQNPLLLIHELYFMLTIKH